MKIESKCIVCNSEEIEKRKVSVNPFVLDRMINHVVPKESMPAEEQFFELTCKCCEFRFLNLRFEFYQENRYYQNYMCEEYIEHRSKFDGTSWQKYSDYYKTEDYYNKRKDAIILMTQSIIDDVASVIDFGGNTGELFPFTFDNKSKFVIDVNDNLLENGVIKLRPNTDMKVDLIICAHVLEHVSDPNELIKAIIKLMNNQKYIYIEVPIETGKYSSIHEHINFWNKSSLSRLLDNFNFEILKVNNINYPTPLITNSLGILAKIK